LEQEFTSALSSLYVELRETFSLTSDDLPQSPLSRMVE
jgi:hypothetical protein